MALKAPPDSAPVALLGGRIWFVSGAINIVLSGITIEKNIDTKGGRVKAPYTIQVLHLKKSDGSATVVARATRDKNYVLRGYRL